ncbi:hypothetical protein C500_13642 [Natrialba magadii ATCC 43099]|uniref:Uncharacterized protein n=1 Tax=Natrialba magadii (strain ATCC 43099 / DSM 3394 / CCM 3739 / CIP 104546 / IAM 13178 / JCM 8861 / NBRC 102185 / NCIMB 2190 / MS3) TaxID=547559 RepID=L9UW69_NATMM|nr:hypothetical protein C500_13642 [Natrialba magadii ATCC 43099]
MVLLTTSQLMLSSLEWITLTRIIASIRPFIIGLTMVTALNLHNQPILDADITFRLHQNLRSGWFNGSRGK